MEKRKEVDQRAMDMLLKRQKDEVTGEIIYNNIAKREKNPENKKVLHTMAREEGEHAGVWFSYTHREVKPDRLKIFWYSIMSWLLGFTFVLKLIQNGEKIASSEYDVLGREFPEALRIAEEERRHENTLVNMLDEERLQYVGSMVLGLNDALVELTGTIAGLTFALANTRLVALSGIITGISATLSMAASNYLAERSDGNKNAFRSSLYTGVAYLITVVLLVLPYLLFPNSLYLGALFTMLATVVLIIFVFNYYISVAKDLPFAKRFGEMAGISLSVAAISFVIGLLVKRFLGIDI